MTHYRLAAAVAAIGLALAPGAPRADDEGQESRGEIRHFQVTITNLTRGQQFTPLLLASHKSSVHLFVLGAAASPQLRTLAEEGNPGPLATLLRATLGVREVVTGTNLTSPGADKSFTIAAGEHDRLSIAAMLIPTNDGFVAVDALNLSFARPDVTVFAPAYDAGTERNDELCSSIPGPFFLECGGAGGGAQVGGGEGFVHIHAGIHGVGDLKPALRDWRNPVAKIVIRRVE